MSEYKAEKHISKMSFWVGRGGLLLVSSLSLISVGFSAWKINSNEKLNRQDSLNVNADGQYSDINKYVKYDKIQGFEFCQDGLVKAVFDDQNNLIGNTIVSYGEVRVLFSIQTEDLIKDHLFKDATAFTMSAYLYDQSNAFISGNSDTLFSSYFKSDLVKAGVSKDSATYDYSAKVNTSFSANCCKISFDVSEYLDQKAVYFAVKYPFSFPTEKFKETIYDKLPGNKFKFSFKAEVTA